MRLNLIVLRAEEPEALVAFYEALGLRFEPEQHGRSPAHFSCQTGGTVLEIYPIQDGPATSGTRIGFLVDDLDKACEAAARLGRVLSQPSRNEMGRRAVVEDPAGHKVELLQTLER